MASEIVSQWMVSSLKARCCVLRIRSILILYNLEAGSRIHIKLVQLKCTHDMSVRILLTETNWQCNRQEIMEFTIRPTRAVPVSQAQEVTVGRLTFISRKGIFYWTPN